MNVTRIGRSRPRRSRAAILPRGYSEEESSTVIVGESAPSLEDVISGAATEQPFDLASFMVFAERRLFLEAVVFLTEVDTLRPETDLHVFQRRLRHIMSEFVGEDAPRQVNLSDGIRQKTEAQATAVLDQLTKTPFADPDRTCLDAAYASVLKLVRDDQYTKYMDHILVQRQLRVSRLEAQWWKNEDLTILEFFTFPSPVDAIESRLHAFLTALLVTAAVTLSLSLRFSWLWLYLTYGFLMRSLCGPRLDPQAFLVLFVLRPLVEERFGPLKDEFLPSPPMRFAQFCGLIMSAGSTTAAFWGRLDVMLVFAVILLFFSSLWSMFNTCIVCSIYLMFVNAKLLPSSFCVECSIRYVKGQGLPTRPSSSRSLSGGALKRNREAILSSAAAAAGTGEDGRRRITPSLLRERFSSSSLWKSQEGKGGQGSGGEEKGKATPAEESPSLSDSNSGDRANSRRLDSSGSARGTSSMRTASEQSNNSDNNNENDTDTTRNRNRISIPRPTSLTARNFLGLSKDFTAAIAPRSKRQKRSKTLADLENYNNLFSGRHSRGGAAGQGRTTASRAYSGRTVSGLNVEPAADVERRPSVDSDDEDEEEVVGKGEEMSTADDDDEVFDLERGARAVTGESAAGGGGGDGDEGAPTPSLAPLFDDGLGGDGGGGRSDDEDSDDSPV